MASSSMRSVNLLGKRKPEDGLDTGPCLRKHKEPSEEKGTTKKLSRTQKAGLLEIKLDQANLIKAKSTVRRKTLLVANLSPEAEISVLISDLIDFFKTVAKVARVQLFVSVFGKHRCCGLVEFASSNDAKKALEKKNGEYLHDHKISLEVARTAPQHLYCVDHKVVWYEKGDLKTKPSLKKLTMGGFCGKKITFSYNNDDYLQQESVLIEENETPPDFVEVVLSVANLSPQTEVPHIIDFFKDVGEVHVRLIVNQEGKHVGYGYVEFDSSNEAKKALEKKNGEYLHDHKIFLDVAKRVPYPPPPKYNLADKLCYEDYLRQVTLLIEEDEPIERLYKPPVFVEALAIREKTLYAIPFSRRTNISHIIGFFKDVGGVVHVRLPVNHMGDHGGYAYVEFATSDEAKRALQKKNGNYFRDRKIFLEMAKMVPSKYFIDHKVWYEDYLRQESSLIKEEAVEGLDETPDFTEEVDVTKRTLFVANLPHGKSASEKISDRISDIISCFHAGEVEEIVCVRLIVNRMGEHVGCAFVEFASANKAKKVLQKKNAQKYKRKIFYDVVKTAPYPLRPKYNLAEKLWYEDYLRRFGEDYLETEAKIIPEKVEEFCGKKIMEEFCGKKITFSYDE